MSIFHTIENKKFKKIKFFNFLEYSCLFKTLLKNKERVYLTLNSLQSNRKIN